MTHFLNAFHKRPIGLWALIPLLSLLAAPAALADDFVCVGLELGTGPFDNVIVPSGARCILRTVMVQGSVEVEPGGRFRALFGTVIQGNVKIGTDGDSIIFQSAVGGNVKAKGAAFFRIGSSVVNGDVEIRKSQLRPSLGNPPPIDLFSSGVADNVIGGNLEVRENDGEIGFFIGSGEFPSGEQSPLDKGSTIGGNVDIEDNGDFMGEGIVIGDNTIGGNLECEENAFVHPDPENPNTVQGNKEDQCSAGNGF